MTEPEAVQLLPCPFCGSPAASGGDEREWQVSCSRDCDGTPCVSKRTRKEAEDFWNCRAPQPRTIGWLFRYKESDDWNFTENAKAAKRYREREYFVQAVYDRKPAPVADAPARDGDNDREVCHQEEQKKLTTTDTLAAIIAEMRAIKHAECEDSWYSCPLSDEGCADKRQEGCTCGTSQIHEIADRLSALSAPDLAKGEAEVCWMCKGTKVWHGAQCKPSKKHPTGYKSIDCPECVDPRGYR